MANKITPDRSGVRYNLNDGNPPPPLGSLPVHVQQEGIDISLNVRAGVGGSGDSIYRTKFHQEPPAPFDGDADLYSNASVVSRGNAAVGDWQTYGPIFALARPLATGQAVTDKFTPINQGSATTDDAHGGIHIFAPIGSGLHAWVRAIDLGSPPIAGPFDYSFQVSHDPHDGHWEEVLKLIGDDFLNPDQIGFFANEASSLFNLRTTLIHWLEGNEEDVS